MKRVVAWAVFFISFFSQGTPADPCVASFLELSYHLDWVCFECQANVLRFVRRLPENSDSLNETEVVFIIDKAAPLKPRDFLSKLGPDFHVVAVSKGIVLDHDFSTSPEIPTPAALSLNDYVTQNFGGLASQAPETTTPVGKLRVRVFRAKDYARLYGTTIKDAKGNEVRADYNFFWNGDIGDLGREITMEQWVQESATANPPGPRAER